MVDTRATRTTDEYRSLLVMEEIEKNPQVSQRQLARSLGSSLGVANACIQTLVRKGLVKIRGESNRSITYHLTKQGLAQKARLAVEWTNNTIGFYVEARRSIREQLSALAARGVRELAVYGANEAGELVVMLSSGVGITVVSVIGSHEPAIADTILGIPVVPLAAATQAQAVLICVEPTPDELDDIRSALPRVPLVSLGGREL